MKRKTISAIITAAAIFISCSGIAIAQPNETVRATLSPQFTIVVDSARRDFYNADGDEVFPIVYNGTTYLPLRAIGELMDKNVNWDQSTLTITLSGTRNDSTVTGKENDNAEKEEISAEVRYDFTIVVDGVVQSFKDANGSAVYPILYEGSTYLPLRAIGTLMGKSVGWDADTQTVYIGTDSETIVTDADTFNSGTVTDADSFNSGMPERQDGDKKGNYENDKQIPFENNQQIPPENQQTNRPDGKGGEGMIPEQYETGITLEEAKAAALDAAGLDESGVTFTKARLDYDDGVLVYDIEFRYGTTEYEYEINASTGAVVSSERDNNNKASNTNSGTNSTANAASITLDEAKEIALGAAGLDAGSVTFTKAKLDKDDGILVYEIEFRYGTTEYEYEINASTGAVVSYDVDIDD